MNRLALVFVLLTLPALAAEPIKLPQPPTPPAPAPVPAAAPLASDQLYVFDSDVQCIVLTSPTGLVKVTEDQGPLKVRAKFVFGTAIETRTYSKKWVYSVEAVGAGRTELIVFPLGSTKEADVIRQLIDAGGVAPKPPDPPTPNPNPNPVDPFQFMLQAAYSADADPDKKASVADLAGVLGAAAKLAYSPNFTTSQGVLEWIKGAESIAATAIPKTRAAIKAELDKVLPKPSTDPLTNDARALMAKTFQRVADALGAVK